LNYAVIMAGGTGTRFWPASRLDQPKQLLCLTDDHTLLEATIERLAALIPLERVMIVTGDKIAEEIARVIPALPADNLISEPLRRNTGPCLILSAKILIDRDPDAILVALPADQVIKKVDLFQRILREAMALAAQEEVLITLGIQPTYPETGYGYIEIGKSAGRRNRLPYHQVAAFHEKPNAQTAEEFFQSGGFLWNAGIFVFRASVLLETARRLMPETVQALERVDGRFDRQSIKRAIDQSYPGLAAVSIDKGVMEHTDNLLVFPADIGWSDVGSWTSLSDLFQPDEHGNVARGDNLLLDSKNNIVYAREGIVVSLGVDQLIIVHTPEATLVARRDDAQAIKKIYDELERHGMKKYL